MPSRVFPWVGIGYPIITMIGIPGIAALMVHLGAGHPAFFDDSMYAAVLLILSFIQIVALVWGVVHAARLVGVRRRLAGSLRGIVPPPARYINAVQLDDAAFYRRDDRTAAVRGLVRLQASVLRFLDEFGGSDSDMVSTGPTDAQLRLDFRKRQQPRRGFLASTVLLTIAWAALIVLMFKAGDWMASTSRALVVIALLGVPLLAVLYTIGGIRNSIDNQFRSRILRLRQEFEAATRRPH